MNRRIETYYQIMNILDDIALGNRYLTTTELIQLQDLSAEGEHSIEDIADANNCGECHTWKELVDCLREQFTNGDRVPINSADDIYSDYISNDVDILNDVYLQLFDSQKSLASVNAGISEYGDSFLGGVQFAMQLVGSYLINNG